MQLLQKQCILFDLLSNLINKEDANLSSTHSLFSLSLAWLSLQIPDINGWDKFYHLHNLRKTKCTAKLTNKLI